MSDKFEGAAREIGGKIEDAAGGLTGDAKTQAEGKVDQVVGKAQQMYGDAKDAVSSAASDASAKASEFGGQAYEKTASAAQYVGGQLREEPLLAVIAAGALGLLVGYLIGRPPHERAFELGRARIAYRDR